MVVMIFQRTGFKICGETHEGKAEGKKKTLKQSNEIRSHLRVQFWKEYQCTKKRDINEQRVLTGLAEWST